MWMIKEGGKGEQRSAEKRKDKGKAIMIKDESVQKKSKKQLEKERLSHKEVIRLQEQIDEEERKGYEETAKSAKTIARRILIKLERKLLTKLSTARPKLSTDSTKIKSMKLEAMVEERRIFKCWFHYHTTNGHQFTMSNRHQELASPEQTASGKDFLNPLMADSLPKTIWLSTHHALQ
ncbi:hypothetical protein Tco_0489606 [Tanacetum coccineum]